MAWSPRAATQPNKITSHCRWMADRRTRRGVDQARGCFVVFGWQPPCTESSWTGVIGDFLALSPVAGVFGVASFVIPPSSTSTQSTS
jgi:hypothetical protein